jgi:hypothetical protein
MHLILTGATGLVGTAVLSHMLSLPAGQIDKISILSRKPIPLAEGHPHVKVILHQDFSDYPREILDQLKGAEGCIWAIGASVSLVSKEEYFKMTVDFPVIAAKAFAPLSSPNPFKFIYVSCNSFLTSLSIHLTASSRLRNHHSLPPNPLLRPH